MSINAVSSLSQPTLPMNKKPEALREAFNQFVGETVFGQMMTSMRKTVQKSDYFHGGRGEEVFQGQLDQEMAKMLAENASDRFTDPLFDLFQLQSR